MARDTRGDVTGEAPRGGARRGAIRGGAARRAVVRGEAVSGGTAQRGVVRGGGPPAEAVRGGAAGGEAVRGGGPREATGAGRAARRGGAGGEPDIARLATAFADPRRVRVLMALTDGRALPAGRLAEEAGVAASTVSNHLGVLLDHELVTVERQGRHRYYRLATSEVEGVLEALAALAPRTPVASLREHTRAAALRSARTCYHHLAGRLGVQVFRQLLDARWITGGDGLHHPGATGDRLSAPGRSTRYRLTPEGAAALSAWGLARGVLSTERPLRYCVDWTEQAHHLAGPLGSAITARFFELGWITRGTVPRGVRVTPLGEDELAAFGTPASTGPA